MIWTKTTQIELQVVPGTPHLFGKKIKICVKDLLEMQEITDIISCALLMQKKNLSIIT